VHEPQITYVSQEGSTKKAEQGFAERALWNAHQEGSTISATTHGQQKIWGIDNKHVLTGNRTSRTARQPTEKARGSKYRRALK
jgi:hypothetical protein